MPRVISVDGQSNETIVLDGEWFEKLRGGEKEVLFQATLRFDGGPVVGFVTGAANREKVEQIISGLECARDSA